jgi:hypothetical protein
MKCLHAKVDVERRLDIQIAPASEFLLQRCSARYVNDVRIELSPVGIAFHVHGETEPRFKLLNLGYRGKQTYLREFSRSPIN